MSEFNILKIDFEFRCQAGDASLMNNECFWGIAEIHSSARRLLCRRFQGRRNIAATVSFLTFFNWIVNSLTLH